mmetsp:Transcript_28103/g.50752  ORF Transcript_28103/g.50752 Transcript_28103/m.50752 type:complete len:106 (-) Transcript_28103:973-1290(-)
MKSMAPAIAVSKRGWGDQRLMSSCVGSNTSLQGCAVANNLGCVLGFHCPCHYHPISGKGLLLTSVAKLAAAMYDKQAGVVGTRPRTHALAWHAGRSRHDCCQNWD